LSARCVRYIEAITVEHHPPVFTFLVEHNFLIYLSIFLVSLPSFFLILLFCWTQLTSFSFYCFGEHNFLLSLSTFFGEQTLLLLPLSSLFWAYSAFNYSPPVSLLSKRREMRKKTEAKNDEKWNLIEKRRKETKRHSIIEKT
jgi:hypothetical protein